MSKETPSKKIIAEHRGSAAKFYSSLIAITFMVGLGAMYLGESDKGEIDVNAAINMANQIRTESGDGSAQVISTQREVHRKLPNGGLVPTDTVVEDKKPAPQPEASNENTGSSTEATEEGQETVEGEEMNSSEDEATPENESEI